MDTAVPIALCWFALFTCWNQSGVSGMFFDNSVPACSTPLALALRRIPNPTTNTTFYAIGISKPTVVSRILFNIGSCSDFNRTASTDITMIFVDASDVTQIPRKYSSSFPGIVDVDYRQVNYELETPLYVNSLLITTPELFDCATISIQGCELSSLCSVNRCKNGGTCIGTDRCDCARGFVGDTCEKRIEDLAVQNLAFQSIIHDTLQTFSGALHVTGNVSIIQSLPGNLKRRSASSEYLLFQDMGGNCSIEDTGTGSAGKRTLGLLLGLSNVFGNLLHHGFSHTITLHLGHNHHHSHTIHLFNTHHGWNQNNVGASLTYNNHALNFVVNGGHHHFHLKLKWTPKFGFPYVLTSSYSPLHGCSLFANGNLLGSVLRPQSTLTPSLSPWTPRLCFGSHCHWGTHVSSPGNYALSHVQAVATSVASLAANALSGLVGLSFQSASTSTNAITTPTTVAMTTTSPTTSATSSTPSNTSPQATATAATVSTAVAANQNSSAQLLCYSCDHMPTDGSCLTPKLCNHGEVCANAKAVMLKSCWECCTSSLCNQQCPQTVTCTDTSQCSLLLSAGFSVCSDPKLASTDCKKTCGHCASG